MYSTANSGTKVAVLQGMNRSSAEDNTGQNTDKGHTPNPRTEIKIPDPAGNRTRASGLEGRDSIDHTMATDYKLIHVKKLKNEKFIF